jgi:hypothetical protein
MTVIKPGEEAECLLSVTPQQGSGVDVEFSYASQVCGNTVTKTAVKTLVDSTVVKPATSAQAYSVNVNGDCTNQYYSCDYPAKAGTFYAGYSCFDTDNKFFSPSNARFDLKYVLPESPSQDIVSATLNLMAGKVNQPQEVSLYTRDTEWSQVSCAPGGDICLRPYCKECADVYEGGLNPLPKTLKVESAGTVSFDVTDSVKAALSAGKTALLYTIGGEEGTWDREGKASCSAVGEWTMKDVEFVGNGDRAPYLEIVYKPKEPPYIPCANDFECIHKRGFDAQCIDGKCVKPDGGVCATNSDCIARLGSGWECHKNYYNYKGKYVCLPQGCSDSRSDIRGIIGQCSVNSECGAGQGCHHIFGDDGGGKKCCCA